MWGYRRRLVRDVARWKSRGWVTAEGEGGILAELNAGGPAGGLASVLGILASTLLGLAAISFVAAHWEEMSRLARLALLFGALWLGYAGACFFHARDMKAFSDAAILFAVAIFGTSIMLISQMFHINGNPPDGVLAWWVGALLAGVLLRSNPALAMALVLVCVWAGMEMEQRNTVYWPFLIGWAAVSAAFAWRQWRPGIHLSGLALALFVMSIGFELFNGHAHALVAGLGLAGVGLAIAGERVRPAFQSLWPAMLGYAAATAFCGLMALQFYENPANGAFIALAAATLILLLALIAWGLASHNRGALWLGYAGFSIEVLAIYAKTVGSLLDTSMFFLVAGLIVAGLAFMAFRLHGREVPGEVTS